MKDETTQRKRQAEGDSLEESGLVAICEILDVYAHLNSYLVTDPNNNRLLACTLHDNSITAIGAKDIKQYIPGTLVLVFFPSHTVYGIIIGAVPFDNGSGDFLLPQHIALMSQVGYYGDRAHYYHFDEVEGSLIKDYSQGAPVDMLPGDWGKINEFGLMFLLSKTMLSMRADDTAKLEFYRLDHLARLVGYNYEFLGAASDNRLIDDEGEYNGIHRMTPYPWEGLGLREPGNASRQGSEDILDHNTHEFAYEPKKDQQLIIPRQTIFRGYLGDLEREVISAPPPIGDFQDGVETLDNDTIHIGLLEITKSANGAFGVRSAKEITLEKYIAIPVPKEKKLPEDPAGDNSKNYKASQRWGSGNMYDKREFNWSDEDTLSRLTLLEEYHSYMFNAYQQFTISSHTKDWYLPEEAAVMDKFEGVSGATFAEGSSFQALGHTFAYGLPDYGELKIDHRQGHTVKYFASKSIIKQCDDGSIVIEDGYGSQIRMSGGNIFLSCPGDIWSQPGRNHIVWAPHDIIQRAGSSVDISAAKADVRIKAEKNLHVLGGNNSSEGGILLESRSEGQLNAEDFTKIGQQVKSYGIVFKAPRSDIVNIGGGIYLGLSGEGRGSATRNPAIDIDAGTSGDVVVHGKDFLTNLRGKLRILVAADGPAESSTINLLEMRDDGTLVAAPLQIRGKTEIVGSDGKVVELVVGGEIKAKGTITTYEGQLKSRDGVSAINTSGVVSKIQGTLILRPDVASIDGYINERLYTAQRDTYKIEESIREDADVSKGNQDFQQAIGFSFRSTEDDLKLDESFKLHEARWQHEYKRKGIIKTWDEPVVVSPSRAEESETYPHPGKQGWKEDQVFKTIGRPVNFDGKTSKQRDQLEADAPALSEQTLDSAYVINVQE